MDRRPICSGRPICRGGARESARGRARQDAAYSAVGGRARRGSACAHGASHAGHGRGRSGRFAGAVVRGRRRPVLVRELSARARRALSQAARGRPRAAHERDRRADLGARSQRDHGRHRRAEHAAERYRAGAGGASRRPRCGPRTGRGRGLLPDWPEPARARAVRRHRLGYAPRAGTDAIASAGIGLALARAGAALGRGYAGRL